MAALHAASGARFIIGLPLNGNNASLQREMIDAAQRALPQDAIMGYELGNEPTYWDCPGLVGGGDLQLVLGFTVAVLGSSKQ